MQALVDFLRGTFGFPYVKRLASDATENETATMAEITGLTITTPLGGKYIFEYYLRVHSLDVLNSFSFAVNYTGSTSSFDYWMSVMGNSAAGAVGAWDQEVNATTGFVLSSFGTRIKNTTLGPGTGVDTANADMMVRITGMFVAATSGDLKLMHASELVQANGTTVKAGSAVILTNVDTTT
jgi:hypothetical protein